MWNGNPICDDHWDHADALVACRMQGYCTLRIKEILHFPSLFRYDGGSPTFQSQFENVSDVFLPIERRFEPV